MSALPQVQSVVRHKGVTWHKRSGKWRVSFERNRVQHHIGLYDSHDDAVIAYLEASRRIVKNPKPQKILWFNLSTGIVTAQNGRVIGHDDRDGYKRIWTKNGTRGLHRMIYEFAYGVDLGNDQIDHINGVVNDNRLCNLRRVSNAENMQNLRKAHSDSSSGIKGVYRKKNGRWRASIGVDYKTIHLGTFATPDAAEKAYSEAAAKYHKYNPSAKGAQK